MTLVRLAALLCIVALPVPAQDLPALHDVTGVAADDVLNVRAEPDASTDIVGMLAPDQRAVEVTAIAGNWGRVNTGERSGWASMAYLAAVEGGAFPQASTLECFGTEPFWSLSVTQDGLSEYRDAEGDTLAFLAGAVTRAQGVTGRYGVMGAGPGGSAALSIRPQDCSDGMSDRAFGLAVEVILGGGPTRVLSGCCSVVAE